MEDKNNFLPYIVLELYNISSDPWDYWQLDIDLMYCFRDERLSKTEWDIVAGNPLSIRTEPHHRLQYIHTI